jgi:protein SCO1/2
MLALFSFARSRALSASLFLWLFSLPALSASDLGGPFELIDQDGINVTQENYTGAPALLYFGFASCANICPTDLARMASLTRTLAEENGIEITPIFVTIDPERDTPEKLASYVKQFHPRFVGLSGSDQAIADIADKYAVYYSPVPMGESYMMDHSTFTFLVGADGHYLAHFPRDMPLTQMSLKIADLLSQPLARN